MLSFKDFLLEMKVSKNLSEIETSLLADLMPGKPHVFNIAKDTVGAVRVIGLSYYMRKVVRNVNAGPEPGGSFWAIAGLNDLPKNTETKNIFMDWGEFFDSHDKVWCRGMQPLTTWQQISSPQQIPDVKAVVYLYSNYDSNDYVDTRIEPMIELYAIRKRQQPSSPYARSIMPPINQEDYDRKLWLVRLRKEEMEKMKAQGMTGARLQQWIKDWDDLNN